MLKALIVLIPLGICCYGNSGELESKTLNVLMLGNSYTGQTWRQLDGFFRADPKFNAAITVIAPGGRQIRQLLQNSKVRDAIQGDNEWDVVVLQEQSQTPAFAMGEGDGADRAREALDAGAPRMIPFIRKHQPEARIILFETWARHRAPDKFATLKVFGGDPVAMQKALCAGYRRMLKHDGENGWDYTKVAQIAPVGRAWEAWYTAKGYEDETFKLHKKDNSHPGQLGAYLTAAVFYETITGRQATASEYTAGLPAEVTKELKRIASQTVLRAQFGQERLPQSGEQDYPQF